MVPPLGGAAVQAVALAEYGVSDSRGNPFCLCFSICIIQITTFSNSIGYWVQSERLLMQFTFEALLAQRTRLLFLPILVTTYMCRTLLIKSIYRQNGQGPATYP